MTTNIILECRQSDTKSVSRNGIYESYLANDIIIEEGDVLMLKNAYIDAKKEGDINIENDLVLTINYGVYFTDWIENITQKIEYVGVSGNDLFNIQPKTENQPFVYRCGSVYKGQRFIPYYSVNSTGADYQQVNSYSYKAVGFVFGEGAQPFEATYQYIDALTNKPMTIHTSIPDTPAGVVYTDVLGLLVKAGSFERISPSDNDLENTYYWKFDSESIVDVPASAIYSPYIFTKTIDLPAGNYSPNNLSLYISKQMSANNIDGYSATISGDSFVKFVSEFNAGMPYPNGATGNIPSDVGTYFFSDDMTTRFRFGSTPPNNSPNYIFGATQTALEFDPESNTFNWAYLHSPMYDGDANISCRIANIGTYVSGGNNPVINNNYLKTTDNGGIFFTGLSAKVKSNNEPFDFWQGILGFSLSKICAEPRPPITTTGTNKFCDLTGKFYSFNLVPGVNITSGYSGVDNSILKNTNWYLISTINPPSSNSSANVVQNPSIFSTISTTTALIADTPYTELIDTFSHYIIDADLHFIGNYVGLDKYNNIQGTVSKYYQVANYVVGSSDGAIQYEHKGLPIMLKSIRIRILRSDKTEDPNLGKDNTILFQLIKSNEITKSK